MAEFKGELVDAEPGAEPASAARDIGWRHGDSEANLKDLDTEIKKTPYPEARKVLEQERASETKRFESTKYNEFKGELVDAPGAPPKDKAPNRNFDFKPWEKEKALGKDIITGLPKELASDLLAGTKLAASVVTMPMGAIADGLARLQVMTQGGSHRDQSQAGTEAFNAITQGADNVIDKLLNWGDLKNDEGAINKGMNLITRKLTEEGDEINFATGGLINTQDFMSITNGLQAAGVAKGMKVTADHVANKIMEKVTKGEKKPLEAAVNDFTFGMNLPESERKAMAKEASKAELRVPTEEATIEVFRSEAPETTIEIPTAGGLPKTVPITLERAAALKAKPGFLLGAEEKATLKSWDEQAKTDEGYGKALEAAGKPGFERTAEDKVYLQKYGRVALAALGGLAAWNALDPEDRPRMMEAALIGLGIALPEGRRNIHDIAENAPMGVARETGKYTSKLLERLPDNAWSFKKAHIEQELRRSDISEAERQVIKLAMEESPTDAVTAKQLIAGFQKATGDFVLKPELTDQFAEFGLDFIDRTTKGMRDPNWSYGSREEFEAATKDEVKPRTTLYRLPEHMEMSADNHFSDPQLFGWTRSFHEEGTRHVVELQSDLAQKMGKPLDEVDAKFIKEDLDDVNKQLKVLNDYNVSVVSIFDKDFPARTADAIDDLKKIDPDVKLKIERELPNPLTDTLQSARGFGGPTTTARKQLQHAVKEVEDQLRAVAESQTNRLGRSAAASQIAPITKTWPKRLIREELREAAYAGESEVRFATADTVAKVEGWLKDEKGKLTSPEHQSIYDRYAKDITKFLKQEGGREITDPKGHTWIEVPVKKTAGRVQMMGNADPRLLALMAGAMVGGYLGYKALDGNTGTLIGAILGFQGAKRFPGMREALAASKEAKAAVVELRNRLSALTGANKARGIDMLNYLKERGAPDYAEHAEAIAGFLDGGKPLEGRAKQIYEEIILPIKEGNLAGLKALKSLNSEDFKVNVAEIEEDYGYHRVRVGARPSFMNAATDMGPRNRGFTTKTFAPIDKEVHSYTTASGESLVGIMKGGKVSLYYEGEVVGTGRINAKTGEFKVGDKIYKQGKASVADIEKQTPIRYYHDPLLAELDASLRIGTALNNAQFLKDLPNMPGFEQFGKKLSKDEPPPLGWKKIGDFSLKNYAFEPHLAEAMEDFLGERGGSAALNAARYANRIMVGSLFWNPLPHIVNVLDHAIVEKGLVGLATNIPGNISAGITAYKEVNSLGPKYRAYLRDGAGMMYADTLLSDFTNKVLEAAGTKAQMGPMAKAMGYANPAEMVRKIYDVSRQSLWKWNDIMMMQGYLVKEAAGMDRIKAMKEVEKHIPNYRLPERVLGSRPLARLLGEPAFTTFGRYDYGRLASYGNMVKDLISKDSSIKDRAHALDQMAMLGVMGLVVYPMILDTFAQNLTGNKNATWTRFGASAIPSLMYDVWQGKELLSAVPSRLFHVSPIIELSAEIMANKDLHSGGVYYHDAPEMLKKAASHLAPVNMMQQQEAGKQTGQQIMWSALGIRSPTDEALQKKSKYIERQKKDAERYKEKLQKAKEEK